MQQNVWAPVALTLPLSAGVVSLVLRLLTLTLPASLLGSTLSIGKGAGLPAHHRSKIA